MANRLAGRVDRIAEKLTPSGGNDLLRMLTEIGGGTYTPAPGDADITLEDIIRAAMQRAPMAPQSLPRAGPGTHTPTSPDARASNGNGASAPEVRQSSADIYRTDPGTVTKRPPPRGRNGQ